MHTFLVHSALILRIVRPWSWIDYGTLPLNRSNNKLRPNDFLFKVTLYNLVYINVLHTVIVEIKLFWTDVIDLLILLKKNKIII